MKHHHIAFYLISLLLVASASAILGGVYGWGQGTQSAHLENGSLTELVRTYIKSERVRYEEVKDSVGRLVASVSASDGGNIMVGDRREREIVSAVERVSPAVVSIVVSKDVPNLEVVYEEPYPGVRIPRYRQRGTRKQQVGAGTGFFVSKDGLIVTNRHVAGDRDSEYVALLHSGEQKTARLIAVDQKNDIAILKIEGNNFSVAPLGDSSSLKPGQSVIAIGNALGEFSHSVSVGIISGLGRNISAAGSTRMVEQLYDVIQTDAAINPGNSGGPLLNIRGEVIGVNVATVQGAQTISFSLPINDVKKRIEQVQETGKIARPFLGIRYAMITPEIKKQFDLTVDDGAVLVGDQNGGLAVVPGSPAGKAGLKSGDVIVNVSKKPVTNARPLEYYLKSYEVGDKVEIDLVRNGVDGNVVVELEELK
jgi:serine protease Do